MSTHLVPGHHAVTLGILAGGAGSRLGGCDKAWLQRDGEALVVSLARRMSLQVDAVMVSANRNPERYLRHGLRSIHDRVHGVGPLGGLDALADACRSPWLLTLPVDLLSLPDDLLQRLQAAGHGAFAKDSDGPQPLVALWQTKRLRDAASAAVDAEDHAVHALQARLGMPAVDFTPLRFGNLNTPADLVAAGIQAA
ncbi:molybdenum cofactor guanylyltransferase MobA [soil metagenome]